jgi:hypothetical protein
LARQSHISLVLLLSLTFENWTLANIRGDVGRRSPSSGLQEAAQDSGGAHYFSYFSAG